MLSFKEFHASHFARYVMLKATQTVNSRQKVILTHPLLDELIKKVYLSLLFYLLFIKQKTLYIKELVNVMA
jgi:hypothetical protein